MLLNDKITVGDSITFRSPTRHGAKKAERQVTNLLKNGDVTVTRFHGWKDFIVHRHEILDNLS